MEIGYEYSGAGMDRYVSDSEGYGGLSSVVAILQPDDVLHISTLSDISSTTAELVFCLREIIRTGTRVVAHSESLSFSAELDPALVLLPLPLQSRLH